MSTLTLTTTWCRPRPVEYVGRRRDVDGRKSATYCQVVDLRTGVPLWVRMDSLMVATTDTSGVAEAVTR